METRHEYHVHIEGGQNPLTLNIRELWRYRDLIVLFTRRTIALTYKQTVLGPLWLVLHPFLTSVVYAAVFKGVARMSTEGVPALLFYLSSHALWNLFADNLKRNATTFTANANIFGKVYFPRLAISLSTLLTSLFEFAIELMMIVLLLVYHAARGQVAPRLDRLWLLPLVVLQTGLLGLGMGIIVSSLTTKYRDLVFVVDFGVSLWMYASPVVYPLSQLEAGSAMYRIMVLNPMTMPQELFRRILLGNGTVSAESAIASLLVTAAALCVGTLLFNHVEKNFIDTI